MAGLIKEFWLEQILLEPWVPTHSFLMDSRDMSEFVYGDKINLADVGADPTTLWNNNSFPVASATRTDANVELLLGTIDTENTIIRNLEQKQLSYNKRESVVLGHRRAIGKEMEQRAAWAWSPTADSALTPVFGSTGADDGNGTRRLSFDDIIKMRNAMQKIVDTEGLILNLTPDGEMDLMLEDKDLYKAIFSDVNQGRLYGFQLRINHYLPHYTAAGNKKAFGAGVTGTDLPPKAMVHHRDYVMRAEGSTDLFLREKDPGERGDIIGYQKRFNAVPLKQRNLGMIYGANV